MCNKEHLVGYVYDELPPADRVAFEAHIGLCAECRQEVSELRRTRQHLAAWSPPEPRLPVRPVPDVSPRRRWIPFVPQSGLAAAAALIVVAGAAAIANVEVRYEGDGSLVLRTGWHSRQDDAGPAGQAPVARAAEAARASEQLKVEMAALQERYTRLERALGQLQAAAETRPAGVVRGGISVADLRKILAESEARQRTETAVQIAQVWKDLSAVRVNDWTRVQQALNQAQGLTHRQLQQQRESIDTLRYLQTVLHQNQK